MKKIAIVDDDRYYAEEIREEIISGQWEYSVQVDLYEDPEIFLSDLQNGRAYDLCLSDIEMPGKNGIELAREIRKVDPYMLLIFLTAYSKYAVQGYTVEAYDYILKERFEEEWKRVSEKIQRKFREMDNDFYLVESSNYFEKIPLSHVLYIYKEKKYTVFVLENREVPVRKSLKQIQEELAGKDQFVQVERAYIANIEMIKRFELREIELINGRRIPLGHVRSSTVREKIHSYYHGRF